MKLLEALLLGVVQGATEFLPVSSSGHLVLVSWWLGLDAPPLIFSVVVHLGTTLAVIAYFWQDWWRIIQSTLQGVLHRSFDWNHNPEHRIMTMLVIGSIPVAVVGFALQDYFENTFSNPAMVSISLFITAGLLIYGEYASSASPDTTHELIPQQIRFIDSIWIGLAQAFAIMPGISRSGSTIAAGLFRGLSRPAAARYSFLLATPAIIGAGLLETLHIISGEAQFTRDLAGVLFIGFVSAALVGFASIALLLQVVKRHRLYGFAAYCVVFGMMSLGAVILRG
ncbi:MAG: undecaprenyl-diphosphate phosphatase [Anaerolineales bacterium]|nr:undecaprenyl-diphosphate phosphatase [Anaerolineales bacterium]